MIAEETQVEACEALASIVDSSMQVTRTAAKARAAIAKVKQVVALVTSISKDREVTPSIAQGVLAPSEIRLLGVNTFLIFLDDSIPLEVKEEVLVRSTGKGLQWFIQVIVSVNPLPEGLECLLSFENLDLS